MRREESALTAEMGKEIGKALFGGIVDTSEIAEKPRSLGANKKWQYTSSRGRHIAIPVSPNEVLTITANGAGNFYGICTSAYTPPSSNTTVPYVSGGDRVWVMPNSTEQVVIPNDGAYIILCTQNGDGGVTAWGVEFINEELDKFSDTLDKSKNYTDKTIKPFNDAIGYNMVAMFAETWQTNDASVITATKEGDDVVVNIIAKTGGKRAGFNIEGVAVGEYILMSFCSAITASFGWGETLGDTWNNIDASKKSIIFKKTTTSQKYVYIAASSYSAGTKITLQGFKVYRLQDLNTLLKSSNYGFTPSSYIPIKERYENHMAISSSGGQGCAIYGDNLVIGFIYSAGYIRIYDMSTKELVQQVNLPSLPNPRYHSNTLSFGAKYSQEDDFPLLYLCSGYTDTASVSTSEVYVIRILGTAGSYTASLIQTITIDFGIVDGWTEFVVDPVKNRAWITGTGIARVVCVALPSTSSSTATINSSTTIIDAFDFRIGPWGTSTSISGQGMYFFHNRIYWAMGVPSYTGEGADALVVLVVNTLSHCVEAVVPLQNYGLSSGTSNTYEPEGCFIWNDDFYIKYNSFVAKLIQK